MDCYRNAHNAYLELAQAGTHDDIQSRWANFLRHAGSVIHSLEGGTREPASLKQWYGVERAKAKRTPFLQYMYQARNAEEHNSLPTLGARSIRTSIDGEGQTFILKNATVGIVIGDNGIDFAPEMLESEAGKRPFLKDCTSVPIVTEIFDEKHNNRFAVPVEYQGEALDPASPRLFAQKYLGYLLDLITRVPKPDAQSPSLDK